MTGTLLNVSTVLLGGSLGLLFGKRLPQKMQQTLVAIIGLFTAAIGVSLFLDTQNPIIVLISLLIGASLGEWWEIEAALERFGTLLQTRFANSEETNSNNFVSGFLTASLVFCVGPLTILGSIQDGLSGDYSLLAIKSVLDGFAALVFAASLGIGVLFSTLVILFYQGGLSLMAAQAEALLSEAMILELTAVGGVLLLGIALSSLLEVKKIRVGNVLPALILAPVVVAAWAFLRLH